MRPNEKLDDRDVRDVQPALAATSTRSTSAIIAAGVISLVSVSLAVAALAVAVAATDKAVAAAPSYRLLFMSCQFAPTPNATAGGIQHGNKDSHGQPVDLAFAWETMADTQPDALISLGDFVYAEYSFEPLDGEWLRYNVLDASDPDEGIKEKCAEKNSTAHNHKCLDGAAFLAYMNRSLVEKLQLVHAAEPPPPEHARHAMPLAGEATRVAHSVTLCTSPLGDHRWRACPGTSAFATKPLSTQCGTTTTSA